MIADADELLELAKTTEDLIECYGMDVTLVRSAWEETPAGGIRPGAPTTLDATRRFFGAVTSDPPRYIREEGEQIIVRHVLVGLPGDDIEEKDTFEIDNRKFEVIDLHPEMDWQTKGWCVERS